MKDKLYRILPNFIQNFLIYLYNVQVYRSRYGGNYRIYRREKFLNRNMSRDELFSYQKKRYKKFIDNSIVKSEYYSTKLKNLKDPSLIYNIGNLPMLSKEALRQNIDKVVVKGSLGKLEKSKTGGTTGKSLEVYYSQNNMQERFAFLDDFRSRHGYELGKKTAWFSGKNLLTFRDVKRNVFWKTDFFHKVRYYSTFHINNLFLKHYVENLIEFKPEFFVGFPSSILEIAKYGTKNGYDFPAGVVKAIFPTAETVTLETRALIEAFFKTKIYDQYASSEGAPFIFECVDGNLHMELQSGVFEVLDENDKPTRSGRLIVTSFTTEATPLIRYDIGDWITLADDTMVCGCGNNNPMVKEILGRIDDFIFSQQTGKINLGNVSNTLKDTFGILRFQAIQNELNKILLLVEIDKLIYDQKVENKFLSNWKERVGDKMDIEIHYVDKIPVERSGKFRIVKNNIKHLID